MRTITLTDGAEILLDGELLTLFEGLYHALNARLELDRSFEETSRELQHVMEQMTEEERRHYFSESLFLNFVSFENDRLGRLMKKLKEIEEAASETRVE